jgi:malonyl-CoA O-methyltransferase
LDKYPELKKDKHLKRILYKKFRNLYFETEDRTYRKNIAELGLGYKLRAMSLKSKLKKMKKNDIKQTEVENKLYSIEKFNKALCWIEKYTVNNNGIAVESNQPETIYPEVTGYYIPTLLKWGERQRAKNFADYLLTIQNEDGSWNEPSGQTPYTFDTGQILKGLWEFVDEDEKYKTAFLNGCDWILTQQREDGSITTSKTSDWALPFGKCVPEAVHVYCLEPLKKAAEEYGIQKYNECVEKALKFYLAQDNLTDFDTLSHFHSYVIEGLIDMGEIKRAQKAMDEVAKIQKKNGSVSAYSHVKFVCSTGLFQYAICWYKLGDKERGDMAFAYALSLQNESGGFFGTYGKESNYFEKGEISWAVKYFLDALYYGQKCSYDKIFNIFPDSIDSDDGRLLVVDKIINENKPQKILDLGCGKGRFSNELMKKNPEAEFYGADISEQILACTPEKLTTKQGSLLNIPFSDDTFDFVFCIEALEHAININGAISEILRVLKKGGKCLIIDKNVEKLGQIQLARWEKWFGKEELINIMQRNDFDVKIIENIPYEHKQDDLFLGWLGLK